MDMPWVSGPWEKPCDTSCNTGPHSLAHIIHVCPRMYVKWAQGYACACQECRACMLCVGLCVCVCVCVCVCCVVLLKTKTKNDLEIQLIKPDLEM